MLKSSPEFKTNSLIDHLLVRAYAMKVRLAFLMGNFDDGLKVLQDWMSEPGAQDTLSKGELYHFQH